MSPMAAGPVQGAPTLSDLLLLLLGVALIGNTVVGHLADRVVNYATAQKTPGAPKSVSPLPDKTHGAVPTAGDLPIVVHPAAGKAK